jgi:hypothetical protein
MKSAYIVPTEMLRTSPPKDDWDARPIDADPTQSLVMVTWDNPNFADEFEALPGVVYLGLPWEPPPAEAVPLLASMQTAIEQTSGALTAVAPSTDSTSSPPASLGRMLRDMGWHPARP